MNRSFLVLPVFLFCLLPFSYADNVTNAPQDPLANPSSQDNDSSQDKDWKFLQSLTYSSGKYGTSMLSQTYEEDTSLKRYFSQGDLELTVPELWQTGNVLATDISRTVIKKKAVTTSNTSTLNPTISGIGDITLNGDYYLLEEGKNAPLDVDLTSYIKAPTASAKKGLGTGQWDGGPGFSLTKKLFWKFKAVSDFSYYFIGKVPGQDTLNQINVDGGLEYDIIPSTTATVTYEYNSSTTKGLTDSQDMALALDYAFDDGWKISLKATAGLTDGAPAESIMLGASMKFSDGLFSVGQDGYRSPINYGDVQGLFDPITERIISDPLFLPLKGQFYGGTSYTYNASSSDSYTAKNVRTHSITDSNAFTQSISYGLSNNLTVRVTETYAFDRSDRTLSTTGAINTANDHGFENPTIATTYRLLEQNDFPVDLDLTAAVAPDSFKDNEAGGGRDGTEASGDQPFTFTTGIGREMKALTVQGTASIEYVGNKFYEALSDDDNYLDKQQFDYTFGLNTQTRLTERFSVNLGMGYTLADNSHTTNLSNGTIFTTYPANTLDFTSALNYQFIPNRLVGGLTYTYDDFTNSKNVYAVAANDTSSKHHESNVFGARLQYLFN